MLQEIERISMKDPVHIYEDYVREVKTIIANRKNVFSFRLYSDGVMGVLIHSGVSEEYVAEVHSAAIEMLNSAMEGGERKLYFTNLTLKDEQHSSNIIRAGLKTLARVGIDKESLRRYAILMLAFCYDKINVDIINKIMSIVNDALDMEVVIEKTIAPQSSPMAYQGIDIDRLKKMNAESLRKRMERQKETDEIIKRVKARSM